jgi:hypothetical protein
VAAHGDSADAAKAKTFGIEQQSTGIGVIEREEIQGGIAGRTIVLPDQRKTIVGGSKNALIAGLAGVTPETGEWYET